MRTWLLALAILLATSACTFEASITNGGANSSTGSPDIENPSPPASPLTLTPNSSLKLLTGESLQFTAGGGQGPFSWSDSGSGFLSPLGLFTLPLTATKQTDFVKVTDANGNSVQSSISIQAFEQNLELPSANMAIRTHQIKNIISFDGAYYASAMPSQTSYSFPDYLTNDGGTIIKSSDLGATWIQLSSFQVAPGVETDIIRLLAHGSELFLVGTFKNPNDIGTGLFLAKSVDKGLSFTTQFTFTEGRSLTLKDSVLSSNGINLVAAGYSLNGSYTDAQIFTCEIASGSCTVFSEISTAITYNWYVAIDKDASGNIYVGGIIRPNTSTGGVKILKSGNHGLNWTLIQNLDGTSYQIQDLAVSSDGNYLVWVGVSGVSTPIVYISSDAGSNWASSNSGCTGWYHNSVVVDSLKTILATCDYPLPTTVGYVRRKTLAGVWTQAKSDNNKIGRVLVQAGEKIFLLSNSEIVRTDDSGASWASPVSAPGMANESLQANLKSIVATSNNTSLYAVGNQHDGIFSSGIIYKSSDSGNNWVLDNSYGSAMDVSFSSIAQSPVTETLIAGGQLGNFWTIHHNSGTGWNSVDGPNLGGSANLSNISTNSVGHFFAIGHYKSGAYDKWYVRESTDDGQSWSVKDDYRYDATKGSAAFGSASSESVLYVVGYGIDASDKYHWLVRAHDGTSWTVLDDDTISVDTTYASAKAALVSANGYLYVAGEYQESGVTKWLIKRMNINTSSPWEIVDNFNFMDTKTGAAALAQDSQGRIFAAGYARDNLGKSYSLIRLSRDGTSWVTVDQHANVGGAEALDIRPCLVDFVCTVGKDLSPTNLLRGIIRILREP